MDYKKEIYALLNSTGIKVHYFYPKNFTELPCISYYFINDTASLQLGNKEYIADLSIQVDVWTDANTSTTEIAEKVKQIFLNIGFVRGFNGDLQDPSGINHKSMRFSGKIDLRNNLVYS